MTRCVPSRGMPAFSQCPGSGATATCQLSDHARPCSGHCHQTTFSCLPQFFPLSMESPTIAIRAPSSRGAERSRSALRGDTEARDASVSIGLGQSADPKMMRNGLGDVRKESFITAMRELHAAHRHPPSPLGRHDSNTRYNGVLHSQQVSAVERCVCSLGPLSPPG